MCRAGVRPAQRCGGAVFAVALCPPLWPRRGLHGRGSRAGMARFDGGHGIAEFVFRPVKIIVVVFHPALSLVFRLAFLYSEKEVCFCLLFLRIYRFWKKLSTKNEKMSDKPDLFEIGKRIRKLRGKASRREFAESFLVAQSSLARWESGESPPDLGFIIRLLSAYNVSLDWLIFGKNKTKNENLTADKQFAPLDGMNWVDGLCIKKSDPEFLEHEKTADTLAVSVSKNIQRIDFIDSKNKKTADTSAVSGEGLTVRCLRLSDENADLLRQNGDLRVEVERQRMDIERRDARIAELERQLAEALKEPQSRQTLLDSERAAAG